MAGVRVICGAGHHAQSFSLARKSLAHGLLRGRSVGKRPGPATAGGDYFPPPGNPALHREAK